MGASNWFKNRYNQDRVMLWIVVPLMAIPFIYPLGLPIPITQDSINAFDALENIPTGGTIFIGGRIGLANWYELAPVDTAVYKHAFKMVQIKQCKIITYGSSFEAATIIQRILTQFVHPETMGAVYGTDYIDLGWIPGDEATNRALVRDMLALVSKDYKGSDLAGMPLIEELKARNGDGVIDINDYDYMYFSITTIIDIFARQWGEATKAERDAGRYCPCVGTTLSGSVPFSLPWVDKGIITAVINSQRGGAEYEQYGSKTYGSYMIGPASMYMDAQNTTHLYAVFLIVIAAVGSAVLRLRKPTEG